ncbi:MAG: ATP-binding protein, partial [Bacteroidales bacterium]|nr:ATP-binding protein [Bacteroidales bacterium]
NKANEMFGEERILQSIFQHQSDTAEAINTVLINDIGKFVGKREQSDDITIFSLRYKPLHKELVIVNNIKDLEKLHHFMTEIQDVIQVPQNDMAMMKVAIDEAMTNVVRYAYADENQPISILAETCGWKLIFTISDQGVPFNPLEYDKPPIEIDPDKIEDIQIGGHGISIMKDSFDELEYKYENYSNILILKKTLDYGSKN